MDVRTSQGVPGKGSILLVEDDPDVAKLVRAHLTQANYRVRAVGSAEQALVRIAKNPPDLIILDVGLPKMDGLELLRRLRPSGGPPVILLSARREELDRVLGLKLGADDYVAKPFSVRELEARVEVVLRRAAAPQGVTPAPGTTTAARFGALEVDLDRHEVRVSGKAVALRPKEFQLLCLLVKADGKVLSRPKILEGVWGYPPELAMDPRKVDQYVARIRRRLASERGRIVTVSTAGYRFNTRP